MRWNQIVLALFLLPLATIATLAQTGAPVAATGAASSLPESSGNSLEVELGTARDWVSGDFADWREHHLRLTLPTGRHRGIWSEIRQTNRFGVSDYGLAAGGDLAISDRWTLATDASWSPTARVLPEWTAGGVLRRAFDGGWGAHLGARHRAYEAAQVLSEEIGVERYWSDYRAGYTLILTQLRDAGSAVSHLLSGSYYYADENGITLVAAVGEEAEALGAGRVEYSRTRALALWGTHWLAPQAGLMFTLGIHDQGAFYTRTHARLGVRLRRSRSENP